MQFFSREFKLCNCFNRNPVLDLLLIDEVEGIAIPMQFKNTFSPSKLYQGQKMQILLEAVMVEKELKLKVPYGLVKFIQDSRIFRVDTYDWRKDQLKRNLEEIKNVVRKEQLPAPTEFKRRCVDCCFRRICARA